jgi:hypothetical protein
MNPKQIFPTTQGRGGTRRNWAIVGIWLLADLMLRGASAATGDAALTNDQSPHKWASSLPSATPQRHVMTTLSYDDLGSHIGERMLITTIYGDLRDVRIESYANEELLVRVGVVGGYATQHIQRNKIRLIRDPE